MNGNKAKATEALKASGFPFQTAISHIVASVPGYSILMEEHSWRDSSGADHFMDILAQYANIVLTIECKKTQKATFSFLNPGNNSDNISGNLCVHLKNVAEVPWVRFTKSFTTTHRGRPFRRTIFIINSQKLNEFLTVLQWEYGRPPTNAEHVYA
jgi:hypothetical protein